MPHWKPHLMFRIILISLALFLATIRSVSAADAIAIAIVFDTSGSMLVSVPGKNGQPVQKFMVARSAMETVVGRIAEFTKSSGKPVQVALFAFDGKAGSREVLPLGAFDAKRLRDALPAREAIAGGTPLGRAADAAARSLMKAKADSRHVLIITDGENSVGPKPEDAIKSLEAEMTKSGAAVQFHFLAFDVNAEVFAGVKRAGATLVSAADEKQLNEKLGILLEEKILLEKE